MMNNDKQRKINAEVQRENYSEVGKLRLVETMKFFFFFECSLF